MIQQFEQFVSVTEGVSFLYKIDGNGQAELLYQGHFYYDKFFIYIDGFFEGLVFAGVEFERQIYDLDKDYDYNEFNWAIDRKSCTKSRYMSNLQGG